MWIGGGVHCSVICIILYYFSSSSLLFLLLLCRFFPVVSFRSLLIFLKYFSRVRLHLITYLIDVKRGARYTHRILSYSIQQTIVTEINYTTTLHRPKKKIWKEGKIQSSSKKLLSCDITGRGNQWHFQFLFHFSLLYKCVHKVKNSTKTKCKKRKRTKIMTTAQKNGIFSFVVVSSVFVF